MTEIRNLKLYPEKRPVEATLYGGMIYGLTGSGSKRFAERLGGLAPIGHGCVRIGGIELSSARKKVGFSNDPPVFCEEQTPYEFLCLSAKLRGADPGQMRLIPRLLDEADLSDVRNRTIRRLNVWQRKKLSVLAAVAGNPELLIFIDLFSDLGESAKQELFALVDALRGESTVLLTGREEDLSPFCDRFLRFRDGEAESGGIEMTGAGTNSVFRLLVRGEREAILRALEEVQGIASCRFGKRNDDGERYLDLAVASVPDLETVLREALAQEGCELREMQREGEEKI